MTDGFHFMTDEIHFMTEPTSVWVRSLSENAPDWAVSRS